MPAALPLALLLSPLPEGYGTGMEWVPIAAVVAGVVAVLLIVWLGSRNTV